MQPCDQQHHKKQEWRCWWQMTFLPVCCLGLPEQSGRRFCVDYGPTDGFHWWCSQEQDNAGGWHEIKPMLQLSTNALKSDGEESKWTVGYSSSLKVQKFGSKGRGIIGITLHMMSSYQQTAWCIPTSSQCSVLKSGSKLSAGINWLLASTFKRSLAMAMEGLLWSVT